MPCISIAYINLNACVNFEPCCIIYCNGMTECFFSDNCIVFHLDEGLTDEITKGIFDTVS